MESRRAGRRRLGCPGRAEGIVYSYVELIPGDPLGTALFGDWSEGVFLCKKSVKNPDVDQCSINVVRLFCNV